MITFEQIQGKVFELEKQGHAQALLDLFSYFGISALQELKEKHFSEFAFYLCKIAESKPHARPDGELNPNNALVCALRDNWHKVCFLLMKKFKLDLVEITSAEITAAFGSDKNNIICHVKNTGKPDEYLELRLVGDVEALQLAEKHGRGLS